MSSLGPTSGCAQPPHHDGPPMHADGSGGRLLQASSVAKANSVQSSWSWARNFAQDKAGMHLPDPPEHRCTGSRLGEFRRSGLSHPTEKVHTQDRELRNTLLHAFKLPTQLFVCPTREKRRLVKDIFSFATNTHMYLRQVFFFVSRRQLSA